MSLGAPREPIQKSAGHPERASERTVIKWTPSELAAVDKAAMFAGMKRAPFIKKWMAAVARRLEEEAA